MKHFIVLSLTVFTSLSYADISGESLKNTKNSDLVICDNKNSPSEKIVLRYVEDYDNVENTTRYGISINRVAASHEFEEFVVYNDNFPIQFFGFTKNSNDSKNLHFRSVDLQDVDLSDEELINNIKPNLSNLSNLKPYGSTLVTEFIFDKNKNEAQVRSLESIGHSATVFDDLRNYSGINCKQMNKVPAKFLSKVSKLKKL